MHACRHFDCNSGMIPQHVSFMEREKDARRGEMGLKIWLVMQLQEVLSRWKGMLLKEGRNSNGLKKVEENEE